jgi:hypothetical protein
MYLSTTNNNGGEINPRRHHLSLGSDQNLCAKATPIWSAFVVP